MYIYIYTHYAYKYIHVFLKKVRCKVRAAAETRATEVEGSKGGWRDQCASLGPEPTGRAGDQDNPRSLPVDQPWLATRS